MRELAISFLLVPPTHTLFTYGLRIDRYPHALVFAFAFAEWFSATLRFVFPLIDHHGVLQGFYESVAGSSTHPHT